MNAQISENFLQNSRKLSGGVPEYLPEGGLVPYLTVARGDEEVARRRVELYLPQDVTGVLIRLLSRDNVAAKKGQVVVISIY